MPSNSSIVCAIAISCAILGVACTSHSDRGQENGRTTEAIQADESPMAEPMDPYLEKLFASPDDFELSSAICSRLFEIADGSDAEEIRRLPRPQQVVLHIIGESGIIGNGGFQYLFESGLADMPALGDAYDTIGMPETGDAVRSAMAIFPNSQPHEDVDERLKYLERLGPTVKHELEKYSAVIWESDREMVRKLAAYVRANRDAFATLRPTKWEDLEELSNKNRPPPSVDSDEQAVGEWLESIGCSVQRWSDIADFPAASKYVAPADGDPILWIRLGQHRATTDAELAALVRYPAIRDVRNLDLQETYVTAVGIEQLFALPMLEELDLNGTDVVDSWLGLIARLSAIKELNLSSTAVSDDGLALLAPAPVLAELDLGNTKITGTGLRAFSSSSRLRSVRLFRCPVTDAQAGDLVGLKHLTKLDLSHTDIGDDTLEKVCGLTDLRSLWLSSTHVTDRGVSSLAKLSKLEDLSLEETSVDGSAFGSGFDSLPLQELLLYGTKVGDSTVQHLSKIESLTRLTLSETMVTDACFEHVANLKNLQSLSLTGTKLEGSNSLRRLEVLRELKHLWLPKGLEKNTNVNYLRRKRPDLDISFL